MGSHFLLVSAATYSFFCAVDTIQRLPDAFVADALVVTFLLWLAWRIGEFDV